MQYGMAQPGRMLLPLEASAWKTTLNWVAAVVLSLLFLVAGVWKITDPAEAAVRMAQVLIPQSLSLPAALGFGILNTFAGVLLIVPRFRRWGAWLAGGLLVAFLVHFGLNYNALRGEECTCFPWVKRAVGPAFFISDGIMLLLAGIAGRWANPSASRRSAVLVLAAVCVFALVSYGVEARRHTGTPAPAEIQVDGKPYSLQQGKIFVYFFDPECVHCTDAARRMAKLKWGDTKIVAVPVQQAQFAQSFMQETGLRGVISTRPGQAAADLSVRGCAGGSGP